MARRDKDDFDFAAYISQTKESDPIAVSSELTKLDKNRQMIYALSGVAASLIPACKKENR